MNQILNTNDNFNLLYDKFIEEKSPSSKRRFFLFKFQLYFSSIIAILLVSVYLYNLYKITTQEKLSRNLINNFNIARLYANSSNYSTIPDNHNSALFSVIGIIEIEKINLHYPIISDVSEELLKIAPCKFYGPEPNEIGNLCIAAHNYNNNKFFSKIKNLIIGDIISIYDLSGNQIKYSVYDKKEISQADLSITLQSTNSKEITLLTCNNIKGKRIVVKARAI